MPDRRPPNQAMLGAIVQDGAPAPAGASPDVRRQTRALGLLACLFFAWGFITVINNTLLPHLRSVFQLDYTQTTIIESVWFIAYFLASLPAAWLIERIGYRRSLVCGLAIMAAGALLMVPASRMPSYAITLAAMFVIAAGITLLQVAANPYVVALGRPETASSRLNLVQAMNSAGTMLAPIFGATLILGRSVSGTARLGAVLSPADRLADAHSVELPYLLVAATLGVLAVIFSLYPLPPIRYGHGTGVVRPSRRGLWRHRNLVFGVPAIFIYLIAEIGVANLFINYVSAPDIGDLTHAQAGHYLALLWGGMMVGRFAGAALMRKIRPDTALACAASGAFGAILVTVCCSGGLSMWALISVGLFHAIMFPTIFTLGIKDLGPLTEEGAGLLVMAIAGGALVIVQGWLADRFGLKLSFLLTAACELYVLFYAVWGSRREGLLF